MSPWKSFGLALLAAICLLGEATGSAHAQCTSPSPGMTRSCATEWSGGTAINLGAPPSFLPSIATSINNAGQVVGFSGAGSATEWSGGSVIDLGSLSGPSVAYGINDAGKAVGFSSGGTGAIATEWSGGNIVDLGALPGSTGSFAFGINDAGQVAGYSVFASRNYATEWSGGNVINLEGLPGSTSSQAFGINDEGQVVGISWYGFDPVATEWSGGSVIELGLGGANAINNAGQAVGYSTGGATEWSGGNVIILGGTSASDINDAGQVVGASGFFAPLPPVPEPSTWAMMLAGLAFAGYRRAKEATQFSCQAAEDRRKFRVAWSAD